MTAANTQPLTYDAHDAAIRRIPQGLNCFAGNDTAHYKIIGILTPAGEEPREFLARATRTNALVHARVTRVYRSWVRVRFTAYIDQGRDSAGVMVDALSSNTWEGVMSSGELHYLVKADLARVTSFSA